MKRLQPAVFIGFIGDSDYPLWGLLCAIVLFGVVVFGLRLRVKRDVGDAGIVLFNLYFGVEWGGGEK